MRSLLNGPRPFPSAAAGADRLSPDMPMPWRGLALLGISFIASLALGIYVAAAMVSAGIEARVSIAQPPRSGAGLDVPAAQTEIAWWEKGVLLACPLH